MVLRSYRGNWPQLAPEVFVDASAQVIGDVALGSGASVWMYAVLRGDVHWIEIGARSNLQDHVMAHVSKGTHPLRIGDDVTIGHHAVVHGCEIHDRVLVGIGARILDGAIIERDAMVGAGALVPPGMRVPSGHLVVGLPARVVRPLRDDERRHILTLAARYQALGRDYLAEATIIDPSHA